MGRLLDRLREQIQSRTTGQVVTLDSGNASNLKNILKQIIRSGTNMINGVDKDRDQVVCIASYSSYGH